jgi:hypothetical protein
MYVRLEFVFLFCIISCILNFIDNFESIIHHTDEFRILKTNTMYVSGFRQHTLAFEEEENGS